MKKMNVMVLLISLFMTFSCTESAQIVSEDFNQASKSSEETYLYELDVLYIGTVTRINELKEQKQSFASKVARKDRTILKKLEKTQKEIEKLVQFKKYLLGLRGPKGPIPIVLPPIGCLVENNCDPRRNFDGVKGMVLIEELKTSHVFLRDLKNNIIAEGGAIGKDQFGQPYIQLEADFKGEMQLEVTVITKEFGEITTKIPVYKK